MQKPSSSGISRDTSMPAVIMPLPDFDFDPTESSIPWRFLTSRGCKVVIGTENGTVAKADHSRMKGPLPGLLSVSGKAKDAYQKMTRASEYLYPISYNDISVAQYDAILLPGGDGLRMQQYLDNATLRSIVLEFWQQHKLIGAICHGVLVAARTIDPKTGRSILYGHKVTAVPELLDKTGDTLYNRLSRRGYIKYPKWVAGEVRDCLESPDDLSFGPNLLTPYVVSDGDLITSRWYRDADLFAEKFTEALEQRVRVDRLVYLSPSPGKS